MLPRDQFCSCCGTGLAGQDYPKRCPGCGAEHYSNPIPVGVLVLPVHDDIGSGRVGVLLVRRAIPPVGQLALPGGFLTTGETWQQGTARELFEETGIRVSAQDVELLNYLPGQDVMFSTPGGRQLLVFSIAPMVPLSSIDLGFKSDESQELVVSWNPAEQLAFPAHTRIFNQVMTRWASAAEQGGD